LPSSSVTFEALLQSRTLPVPLGEVLALLDRARRDAAGVEGPHRQLRARLADRLGGDDADRQALSTRRPVDRSMP
jgi:hypothetical protein